MQCNVTWGTHAATRLELTRRAISIYSHSRDWSMVVLCKRIERKIKILTPPKNNDLKWPSPWSNGEIMWPSDRQWWSVKLRPQRQQTVIALVRKEKRLYNIVNPRFLGSPSKENESFLGRHLRWYIQSLKNIYFNNYKYPYTSKIPVFRWFCIAARISKTCATVSS